MRFPATLLFAVIAAANLFADSNQLAQPASEWDRVFQRTNGWIGADGDYSLRISDDKILWLFSDTWTGEVVDGKRVKPRMINNSIGIQRGTNPTTASLEFFYRTNADKQATAFFLPESERGYFWPFAGVRTDKGVFVFLQNVENYKTGTPFGFRTFDTVLARIPNPGDQPLQWKIEQTKIPFAKFASEEKLMLGGAVLHEKPYVFIYGTHTQTNKNRHGDLVVIRVRENQIADFGQWEFFTRSGWSKTNRELQSIAAKMASEFSVSWLPAQKKYALVHSENIFGRIQIRFAEKPEGPWSEPKLIYVTPESQWKGVFCYAGKGHPALSGNSNELIVSYAANAWDFFQVINDARLYWPRFVKVSIDSLEP